MNNEKYVINIGRQFGAGGLAIAEKLSKKLGINYYDKKLIEIAAKKSGLGEKYFEKSEDKPPLGFIGDLSGLAANIFGAGYYSDNFLLDDSLFKIQSDLIKQISRKESSIFVGRCADYVLRDNPRCVNVFVCAGMETRIKRLCQNEREFEKMRKNIERTDKQRAKYYTFYSGKAWGAADSYHMCVDSSVLGIDATVELICYFASKKLNM